MEYFYDFATNVGTKKEVNQDSIYVSEAQLLNGKAIIAVICDGMGGLSFGEIASGSVVATFSKWFEKDFPKLVNENRITTIHDEWNNTIRRANHALVQYGNEHHTQLGTTLSAILIMPDMTYYTAHVGDSRIYKHSQNEVAQITEDQTFIAREISLGRMTYEEAQQDSRRNLLLECIGVTDSVNPIMGKGAVTVGDEFLLCSDGFRHMISAEEIKECMDKCAKDKKHIASTLNRFIGLNMKRGETDNITAIFIKVGRD